MFCEALEGILMEDKNDLAFITFASVILSTYFPYLEKVNFVEGYLWWCMNATVPSHPNKVLTAGNDLNGGRKLELVRPLSIYWKTFPLIASNSYLYFYDWNRLFIFVITSIFLVWNRQGIKITIRELVCNRVEHI